MTKEQTLAFAEIAYQAARKAQAAGEPFEVVQGLLRRAGILLKEADQMSSS